ncbi:MAG: maleylacetoacetate isomerase [Candidatus Protistobacter heckmanni]|nr:maleylacetoacetate isomerase [Candidatus Protistobacter heckmanni]
MQLYSFFNSSSSYRVRIALKGLKPDYVGVNIRVKEHRKDGYVALNPSASVPALVDGEVGLGQSLAIIDYLDATHPEPRLIPEDPVLRAHALELAYAVSCDIHPVNNTRVLGYLSNVLQLGEEQKTAWYRHWVQDGMAAVERLLVKNGQGAYCFGDAPGIADCCLVPQIANAMRMGCPMQDFPRAMAVYAHCMNHPAFQAAAPAQQPDFIQ